MRTDPTPRHVERGENSLQCTIPGEFLNTGDYRIVVNCFRKGRLLFSIPESIAFEIHEPKREGAWFGKRAGVVRPKLQWQHDVVRSASASTIGRKGEDQ
ncbi:MAG: hypothetical protein IPO87_14710 [Flavobacteriales bacterium]|nr:hypothetical protein [Flavobacteriales bacterium]